MQKLLNFDRERYRAKQQELRDKAEYKKAQNLSPLGFISPNHKYMVSISNAKTPDKGTYYIYDNGSWRLFKNLVFAVQQEMYQICKNLGQDTDKATYINMATVFLQNVILPTAQIFKDYDKMAFEEAGTIAVFTQQSRYEISQTLGIQQFAVDSTIRNRWSIAVEPQQKPTPLFDNFLDVVTCNDKDMQKTIMQMIALCLTPHSLHPYFFLLHGKGKNGKSTLQKIISLMLGGKNCTAIALEKLSEQNAENLANALVNLAPENNDDKINEALLKQLSSAETFTCNPKFRDPYEVEPIAKLVFALNTMPLTTDLTEGFFRRCVPIPFNAYISNPDPLFIGKIARSGELAGVAYKALQELAEILKNNGEIFLADSVKASRSKYKQDSSTVLILLDEIKQALATDSYDTISKQCFVSIAETENTRTGKVQAHKMFEIYTDFCNKKGYKKMGDKKFKLQISNAENDDYQISREMQHASKLCYVFSVAKISMRDMLQHAVATAIIGTEVTANTDENGNIQAITIAKAEAF